MTAILDPAEARAQLDSMFVMECHRRAEMRRAWLPLIDPNAKKEDKRVAFALLDAALRTWAKNPTKFIEDMAWAPDPLEKFAQIPEGLTPKGMIPIMPFKKQRDFIEMWWKALSGRRRCDIFGEKSRQQAFTTLAGWLCLHAWLFRKSTYGMLTTFSEEKIDKGGKGQRESDSLFGRLRLFLDAFLWSFGPCVGPGAGSILRFNQDQAVIGRWKADDKRKFNQNVTGLTEADDITKKLTRPRWCIGDHKHGWRELFPGAEGNYIVGEMPSDAAGRSLTLTYAIFDELAHYRKEIRRISTPDDDVYSASASNVRVRVGWGTPPKGGGSDTLLYRELHVNGPSPIKRTFRMHWTENPAFMIGAWWRCGACGHANPVPPFPSPVWPSERKECSGCRKTVEVRARGIYAPSGGDYSSPLYEDECAAIPDKAGVAAEMEIDWRGAQIERFFYTWEPAAGIGKLQPSPYMTTLEGLDPGHTTDNPCAWICARWDQQRQWVYPVGYLIVAGQMIPWLIPFIKRWKPSRLLSNDNPMMVPWGQHAGRLWRDAYRYEDAHLEMMARVSAVPMADWDRGAIYGDKVGSHKFMTSSPYDDLWRYGISVNYEYTKDRQELCRKGIDWAARMTIDEEIANVRFPMGTGRDFPTIAEVFQTALPKPHTGQGEYKLDVDKQDPPNCSDLVDAWLYLCRGLPDDVHARADAGGRWSVSPNEDAEVVVWGEGAL